MSQKIISYIREGKSRKPLAVMMAVQSGDKVGVGYALCNRKDHFVKALGNDLAERRAMAFITKDPRVKKQPIPDTIRKELPKFIGRCKKYFRDKQFPQWAEELNIQAEQQPA